MQLTVDLKGSRDGLGKVHPVDAGRHETASGGDLGAQAASPLPCAPPGRRLPAVGHGQALRLGDGGFRHRLRLADSRRLRFHERDAAGALRAMPAFCASTKARPKSSAPSLPAPCWDVGAVGWQQLAAHAFSRLRATASATPDAVHAGGQPLPCPTSPGPDLPGLRRGSDPPGIRRSAGFTVLRAAQHQRQRPTRVQKASPDAGRVP